MEIDDDVSLLMSLMLINFCRRLMLFLFLLLMLFLFDESSFSLMKRLAQRLRVNSEVILNGDSHVPTLIVKGVFQPVAPTTAEQRLARKNKLKAHGTLLMALPDKHRLKFNSHKDAKTLMEAMRRDLVGTLKPRKFK
nr:hypothetical protein [Tanacetum cinerariifolium]